jgi:hypothetical protein
VCLERAAAVAPSPLMLWARSVKADPARADGLSPAVGVSAQWKMPRVEDDALAVTGLEAGQRARIDFEALEDPGASDDEDDNQQASGEILLHAPAVFELRELLLAR